MENQFPIPLDHQTDFQGQEYTLIPNPHSILTKPESSSPATTSLQTMKATTNRIPKQDIKEQDSMVLFNDGEIRPICRN